MTKTEQNRVLAWRLKVLRRLHTPGPKVVMSNSFGFGGTNASLVFRHWPA